MVSNSKFAFHQPNVNTPTSVSSSIIEPKLYNLDKINDLKFDIVDDFILEKIKSCFEQGNVSLRTVFMFGERIRDCISKTSFGDTEILIHEDELLLEKIKAALLDQTEKNDVRIEINKNNFAIIDKPPAPRRLSFNATSVTINFYFKSILLIYHLKAFF